MRKSSIAIVLGALALIVGIMAPAQAATPYEEARADLALAVEYEQHGFEVRQEGLELYRAYRVRADNADHQAEIKRRSAEEKLTSGDPVQRDEAKVQLTEAIELHEFANLSREEGLEVYEGFHAVADSVDNQASAYRLRAKQTFTDAGFPDEAKAAGLRSKGHQYRGEAAKASGQAGADLSMASSLRARSASLHQSVLVIRATDPDAELTADASEFDRQSRADTRTARQLQSEAKRLTSRARSADRIADTSYRKADRLDPGGV